VTPAVLELAEVTKDYRGLRPLRIHRLVVAAGESVAILGVDGVMAEVFVNLVTGAAVPDRGEIQVFGRPTTAVSDSAEWLALVDRFGIVSERAVLLDALTVIQNLAMPFTLDIEPPPPADRARAEALAREVGLDESAWTAPVARLDAAAAMRVRLGRAIALDPGVLLLEHASAPLPPEAAAGFAATVRAVAERRGIAVVALTADEAFARALDGIVLVPEPASGALNQRARGWFSGLRRR